MRPDESFVGQPVRSLQTMLRVIAEDDPQLLSVVPDGVYGQQTLSAVNQFQRKYGLPITGITDQNTWETVVSVYEKSLVNVGKAQPIEILIEPGQVFSKGDSSPYLYLLQSMLLVLTQNGLDAEPPGQTGILDDSTAEALTAFQLLAELPPTGQLDKLTWKHLVNHFTLEVNRIDGIKKRKIN